MSINSKVEIAHCYSKINILQGRVDGLRIFTRWTQMTKYSREFILRKREELAKAEREITQEKAKLVLLGENYGETNR